jgi:hypothetical protein
MRLQVFVATSCSLLALAIYSRETSTAPATADAPAPSARDPLPRTPLLGNPEKLRSEYERWKLMNDSGTGADRIALGLAWSKGRSSEYTPATGEAVIDLAEQEVSFYVRGFAEEVTGLDAWMVEYRPGMGAEYDAREDELLVPLGTLSLAEGEGSAVLALDDELMGAFELDLIALSRPGTYPSDGGLLYGTPDLFQRVYSAERRARHAADEAADEVQVRGLLLGLAAPPPLPGGPEPDPGPSLDQLILEGERLFCEETFEGNGRTCCTCHPFANNLTIEPLFIATLPDSDKLFVAETLPTLNKDLNGGLFFENPVLMREFGLIVENLDGFGDLKKRFTMRSVPHTLALRTSITTPPGGLTPPKHRTGWSGDGAPNDGALRDFATGAVTQHFPITLHREPDVDFRLPTPDELTAMEAFQLSTGRFEDPDTDTMTFVDPEVQLGRGDFSANRCSSCHFHAGANSRFLDPPIFNENFDTGVEEFTQNHPDGTGEKRPVDGGFGLNPEGTFDELIPNPDGSFGDGTFNTPPLVELADTLPAFHSNITNIPGSGLIDTVEGAIRFYNSFEFNTSPGGLLVGGIAMSQLEIQRIGKFLRVLNALENERSASDFAQRAQSILFGVDPPDLDRVELLLTLGAAECEDGIEVLAGANLHLDVREDFKKARLLLLQATSGSVPSRIAKISAALEILAALRPKMVTE